MISYLIGTLGIVLILFAFYVFQSRKQVAELKDKLIDQSEELKEAEDSEHVLRDEVNSLQSKLNQTIEDPVTHLLGWHLFEDRLQQNIRESERYQFTLGLMLVDIDEFKVVNDALSYETGDALLQEVAKRLQNCIRQVDSVTRFSKDTFVLLLAQLNKPETAAVVAQRILQALKEPFQIDDEELFITVRIGISIYPTDGQNAAELLRSADHALHLAKQKSRHSYQFYQQQMHAQSQRELVLHSSLNRENVFNEFILYYQPILNMKSETTFAMDTLMQWQHPELGMISTQEIINYAEKQRKLSFIYEWLVKAACKQFLYWRSLGFASECIAIPLPMKLLESSQFIYRISQILQELEFHPEFLLLEVEESTIQLPFATLEKAFNMLKYIGVRIAIDNFGAEAFSLRHLKNVGINYLKLAPALIEDIDSNKQTLALIKSIIFMANSLSMQIIIQGVESDHQVTVLKELGCYLMQGRFLGSPLSEREVADKMVVST